MGQIDFCWGLGPHPTSPAGSTEAAAILIHSFISKRSTLAFCQRSDVFHLFSAGEGHKQLGANPDTKPSPNNNDISRQMLHNFFLCFSIRFSN